MASSHILQIFLRVTIQNQICIAQRIIVDEINKVTKIASGFLGVVVLIALAAGGGFYVFAKQKQKKQAEKEALDPDANYTEDKGDFEIPVEDEPEEPGEEDTEPI
jgi:hypothetical protein